MKNRIADIIRRSIRIKGLWIDLDSQDLVEKYLLNICNIECSDMDELISAYKSAVDDIDMSELKVRKYYVRAPYGVDIFYARSKEVVINFVEKYYVNRFGNRLPRRDVARLVICD